jgi:sulfate transport system ATP-binding protein
VALARALAVEPKVLLLDEPFGALDAKVRQGLRNWLRKLHDEIHLTSILVTHDQEEALEVADRVVVMNQARIEQVGTPDEVFHRPANRFVMEFLGQVNVFHGRLVQGQPVFGGPGAASPAASSEGDHLYVRPHELQIERHLNGKSAIPASVKRINRAGAFAKVELEGEQGERIWVDLSLQEADALALEAQQRVYVSAKQARTFSPEYNI